MVNPDARDNPKSPIAGMPIIEVDRAHNVVVLKRGKGKGFSGLGRIRYSSNRTRDVVWRREIRCLSWRRPCNRRELEMIIAAWREQDKDIDCLVGHQKMNVTKLISLVICYLLFAAVVLAYGQIRLPGVSVAKRFETRCGWYSN